MIVFEIYIKSLHNVERVAALENVCMQMVCFACKRFKNTAQDLMAKSVRNSDLDLHSTRENGTRDVLCS